METNSKFLKFIAKVEASNEKFNAASLEEKRVMIAEDCIKRIELGQIKAMKSTIFRTKNRFSDETLLGDKVPDQFRKAKGSLQDALACGVTCEACAKGGLLLSYVARVNEFNELQQVGSNGVRGKEHKKLGELFSMQQLALIEVAFEGTLLLLSGNGDFATKLVDKKDRENAEVFYRQNCYNAPERLTKICKNIIKNEGTFKP